MITERRGDFPNSNLEERRIERPKISSTFLNDATNPLSSTFLRDATGADTSVNLGSRLRKPRPIFEEMEVNFEDGLIFEQVFERS
jgi:hypothetical protein